MSDPGRAATPKREPVLNPVDRVSEMLFGLFMALTFVGAISVAESGDAQIRTMFIAALGCNLAWGLVDAVMYLVRTVIERGRWLTLVRRVRGADNDGVGRALLMDALPQGMARLVSEAEIEAVRVRVAAMTDLPPRPKPDRRDFVAALAIFLIVVVSTFPVVLPFALFEDVRTAKNVSRGIALGMLFLGGFVLGRYAGYGGRRVGFMMTGLGTALVLAINALGG